MLECLFTQGIRIREFKERWNVQRKLLTPGRHWRHLRNYWRADSGSAPCLEATTSTPGTSTLQHTEHMNILDQIIEHKRKEVSERKELYPIKFLEQSIFFGTQPVSLKRYIQREDKSGIIAELKRKSPSKGVINPHVSVERTSIGYMQAGASALSVLTDKNLFGGSNEDLTMARKFNFCPILRKDFTIDEYQIIEAKSIGADAILLIAAALDAPRLKTLASFAHTFGLEVLLEVHN